MQSPRHHLPILALAVLSLVAASCAGEDPRLVAATPTVADGGSGAALSTAESSTSSAATRTATATDITDETAVVPTASRQRVDVVGRRGHDTDAFTQGLVFDGPRLYESRGGYGESALTEIDPESGEVLRSVALDDDLFAEGLALVDDRLIQLTWRAGIAFVYDIETFEVIDQYAYEGEGWGLCHDGTDLWMSDGTSVLTRRNSTTFEVLGRVQVSDDAGAAVDGLNELECIDGSVWANVWRTETIAIIDPASGAVTSIVTASGLLTASEVEAGVDVLNGIAYDEVEDVVVLTGKLWPAMFEVDLVACGIEC